MFSLACFFPALAVLGFFVSAEVLLVLAGAGGVYFLSDVLLILGLVGFPAILTYVCYRLCRDSKKWWFTAVSLYVCWLILGFVASFLVSATVAGVSMAVVEGAVGGWDLLAQELSFAVSLLLTAHLFIVPWVGVSTWVLRRQPEYFFGR